MTKKDAERIQALEDRVSNIWVAFNQLVKAHNGHKHDIEWPQVMTIVPGPRCTVANIRAK